MDSLRYLESETQIKADEIPDSELEPLSPQQLAYYKDLSDQIDQTQFELDNGIKLIQKEWEEYKKSKDYQKYLKDTAGQKSEKLNSAGVPFTVDETALINKIKEQRQKFQNRIDKFQKIKEEKIEKIDRNFRKTERV